MDISSLPDELLEHILSYLSVVTDLYVASKVSKLWRKICSDVFGFKIETFHKESRNGNFVWRLCGEQKSAGRTMHFVPKHMKPRPASFDDLSKPSPRVMHNATFYKNTIYVYGGETSQKTSYFNDMFGYDVLTQKWEKVKSSNPSPTPRSSFSLVRNDDNILISGGCISSRTPIRITEKIFDDVFSYNITNKSWNKCGSLRTKRYLHQSTCLKSGDSLKLVLVGGIGENPHLGPTQIEVCTLAVDSNNLYNLTGTNTFDFPDVLIRHSQCKIDDHRILVYGGMTKFPDQPIKCFIRNDAWLLEFDDLYEAVTFTKITVENVSVYHGMFPSVTNDYVRIRDFLVYFQRSCFIKESANRPDLFEVDHDRKPTGDAIYRQDYYHTFILDISQVVATKTITWQPVLNNPPKMAPRNSLFHKTVLAGDSIYVFGGSIHDRRTKQPQDSNNLYKVNVVRRIEN